MVKKSAVIFAIIATLALSAAVCSAYTVNQWPSKGLPNFTIFKGDSPCLPGQETWIQGPVAPACTPPLIPGAIHAGMSIPFRAFALVATPLFTGQLPPREDCCEIELGKPAYVTAAVPCTPVNQCISPGGW